MRVLIVGAGHSGICLGVHLGRAGIDYTILERASSLGGTWRDNIYPGAACDSPAFAYCYSFEQKTDWSRKWAPQPEILAYQEHCARKYGVLDNIRFDTEVVSARYDASLTCWSVRTANGETLTADILVSAVGQLSRPKQPDIEGLGDFHGPCFHSARWDTSAELDGKRVAVIGNAASAVQLVPAIAPKVKHLSVFQRSANWLFPKNDRVYSRWEQALYRRVTPLARLYRWWLWLMYELRYPVIRGKRFLSRRATDAAIEHLEEQVPDPQLRSQLVPDYPIAAKRVLISDDYYPALVRDNVELVTDPIDKVTRTGVITGGGREHHVDAIIMATGFDTTAFLAPMEITGTHGTLDEAWSRGAEAYLGVSVAGFPNLFLMYGPNTNLGHNSIIFMIECQTRYIMDCLGKMRARGLRSIDVRADVQARYNQQIHADLDNTVWAQIDQSWYRLGGGRITNNWPRSTPAYWWRTRRAHLGDYSVTTS